MSYKNILFTATFISFFYSSIAFADHKINHIQYKGNNRIPDETIFAYLDVNKGDSIDQDKLDQATKSLFKTGFFSDVAMTVSGSELTVQVQENPMINKVYFDGNHKIDDDDLLPEVNLKSRAIFSNSKVQEDVNKLIKLYQKSGRYSVKIQPKLIHLDQNRVNLIYEIYEGAEAVIQNIIFDGNNSYSHSDLAEVIMSKEYKWYRFFSNAATYDYDKMRYDAELLRKFYMNHGFANFRVISRVAELSPTKESFIMTFVIDEGDVYTYQDFNLDCALKKIDTNDLQKIIELKVGAEFNQGDIEETVEALTDYLGNYGYPFVEITPIIHRHDSTKTVSITFKVKEEYKAYVNKITIKNNSRTLDKVIRREFKIAEGDPYNISKIQRSKQKIEDLAFFQKVDFKNVKTEDPDKIDIEVEVEEASTGGLNLLGGYNTSSGALGSVTLTEQNFLGKGQEVSLGTSFSKKDKEFNFSFTEPKFLDKDLSAGFDLFHSSHNSQKESSFSSKKAGFILRTGYGLTEYLSHGISYGYKKEKVYNVPTNASRYVKQQEGRYGISAISHSLVYDKRDSATDPKQGYLMRFDQELAGVGGNTKYFANAVSGAHYTPFFKKAATLVFKAEAGAKRGLKKQKLRLADRYFVGADQLRGFRDAGIGPRDTLSLEHEALGGKKFVTSTVEFVFPVGLPRELDVKGAIFHDAATLYGTDEKGVGILDKRNFRASYGASLYWKSPLGNIGLHYGIPYKKQKFDKVSKFNLTFGHAF